MFRYRINYLHHKYHRDTHWDIEAALWQEVEEAREAERAEELNEPVMDVEPTAEAPAQESGVESKNQKATEVVEIKLSTYNLKKDGQAPVSITLKSKDLTATN